MSFIKRLEALERRAAASAPPVNQCIHMQAPKRH
jgi:hypothetical protein